MKEKKVWKVCILYKIGSAPDKIGKEKKRIGPDRGFSIFDKEVHQNNLNYLIYLAYVQTHSTSTL